MEVFFLLYNFRRGERALWGHVPMQLFGADVLRWLSAVGATKPSSGQCLNFIQPCLWGGFDDVNFPLWICEAYGVLAKVSCWQSSPLKPLSSLDSPPNCGGLSRNPFAFALLLQFTVVSLIHIYVREGGLVWKGWQQHSDYVLKIAWKIKRKKTRVSKLLVHWSILERDEVSVYSPSYKHLTKLPFPRLGRQSKAGEWTPVLKYGFSVGSAQLPTPAF